MARKTSKPLSQNDEPDVPGPINPEAINKELGILRYVEKETHHEKVLFLEKVKTELVFDTPIDIWNVHTDKNKYWVFTNPAGLFSQAQFPSFDYAFTFHVGLTYRRASNQRADEAEKQQDQLAVPWRLLDQAAVALETATEAEEYQAVGILCRQCLLSFVKTVSSNDMVPVDQDRPKMADFVAWSEFVANAIVQGSGAEGLRSYLKTISKAAWQLVNWLARTANAARFDGNMAIQATEYVLMAFGAALLADKNDDPDR